MFSSNLLSFVFNFVESPGCALSACTYRVAVWLLQPLVSGVERLERVLDLCSGLGGAAQAACDLRPAADVRGQDPQQVPTVVSSSPVRLQRRPAAGGEPAPA